MSSDYIVEFVRQHRIVWGDRNLARRGGEGDMAGLPPVSSALMFLELVKLNDGLFTQSDYFDHCVRRWGEWYDGQPELLQQGIKAKAFGNFYPSFIDSLHVWSLLSETGTCDRCFLNSTDDVHKDTDLTIYMDGRSVVVALIGPTARARKCRDYKQKFRGASTESVTVQLPWNRPRDPGNKRWYVIEDFEKVF